MPIRAVPHNDRVRRDKRGEPVECPLGADLLEGADHDVRYQNPEEQSVPPGREREDEHPEDRTGSR